MEIRVSTIPRTPKRQIPRCARRWYRRLRRPILRSSPSEVTSFITATTRNDWKVWDSETAVWREKKIPVYPALGNHDLHGDEKVALANYFERFPDLKNSRYYSVRAGNTLMLVLDSSQD